MFVTWLSCSLIMTGALLVLSLFSLVSSFIKFGSSSTVFECGFLPYLTTHRIFSIHFYRVAILFILFDVELSILLPYCNLNFVSSLTPLFILFSFLVVLLFGFLLELMSYSLFIFTDSARSTRLAPCSLRRSFSSRGFSSSCRIHPSFASLPMLKYGYIESCKDSVACIRGLDQTGYGESIYSEGNRGLSDLASVQLSTSAGIPISSFSAGLDREFSNVPASSFPISSNSGRLLLLDRDSSFSSEFSN